MKALLEYLTTTARLLGNAARFRLKRATAAPLKPEALSLAVTGRCNSRCTMCNIWRRAREEPGLRECELTRGEITALLARPLFAGLVELDLTGGEPHLRQDLADIVGDIAALKPDCLPRLRSVVITSNGLLPDRIIANYERMMESLRGRAIDLVAVASLDGIGAAHDRIRGVKGAFALADKTIGGLVELKRRYPGFYPGIKTTVLPANLDSLDGILDYAVARGLFYIISPACFTEARFRNIAEREKLQLGEEHRERLAGFYARPEFDGLYFYSRLRRALAGKGKGWFCTAGYNYLFIEDDGTVYPCELVNERLGNIREQPVEAIWEGAAARRWRRNAGKPAACQTCLEPGAVRYSAAATGLSYLGFLAGRGRRGVPKSLHGEGYRKYLGG